MRRLIPGLLLFAVFATSAAACNKAKTPTTPTTPTPPTVTEVFSGTLTLNGASTFPFSATAGGTVTATLTTLTPDSTLAIGMSLGTWTGSACQVVTANDSAAQAAAISATATAAAALCVRVYDPASKVATPSAFSVTIVHP
jgi:hypothetical protein